jgi:glycosyltransferase involved in cell wall biosynthesis
LTRADVPFAVVEESGPVDVRLLWRTRRILQSWAPSVVQTHGYKPTALVYALRRLGASWPWIAFFHGTTSENAKTKFYHWLDRRLMASADRVVVMARDQARRLSAFGTRVRVVYNAVAPLPPGDEAPNGQQTPTLPLDNLVPPTFGVVGRLSPEKGVDVFLRACRTLADRGLTYTGLIVGDGPERQNLERMRDALELRERVRFTGATPCVDSVYSCLDLLVIPSRSEGLPNVLLEALNADVPVVATTVGAIPDVVEDSGAGVLVPPGAAVALADAIERALPLRNDPASSIARRVVCDRFSTVRRMEEHVRLYEELLGPSRAPA